MREFASLYQRLDSTTSTNEKVSLLRDFFRTADRRDAAWVLYFLLGSRRKRAVTAKNLATWAARFAGVSAWLYDECYNAVGDSAETIALLLPEGRSTADHAPLHEWVENRLLPLSNMDAPEQRNVVELAWRELDRPGQFVWNKLITGAFRVGVSKTLIVRALAQAFEADRTVLLARLMHDVEPSAAWFETLLSPDAGGSANPVPFCLAYAIDVPLVELGSPAEWQVEWKWDGIRAQLVRQGAAIHLWSRGDELVTQQFPEIITAAGRLPDQIVLDGEILAWNDAGVMPFSSL